jgi:hypothetical protein
MSDQVEVLQMAPSGTRAMFIAIPKAAIGTLRLGQLFRSPHSRHSSRTALDTLQTVSAIATPAALRPLRTLTIL